MFTFLFSITIFTTIYLPLSTVSYLTFLDKKTRMMELFAKIVHSFRRLTISVESSILDVGLSSEYASADSQFSQKAKGLN